jgi:predicted ABC-type ATPase
MKRMRVFAGPNGSGKTTLVAQFIKEKSKLINPNRHINPDHLNLIDVLDFDNFGLKVDESDFRDFIFQSPFYSDSYIDIKDIQVNNNRFNIINRNSYMGAMLADYLRHCYIYSKETLFSYETVLSHSSKIDFFKNAKNCGWQVYLYFVSTIDVCINQSRVEERVLKGEHDVPPDKIQDRYTRSHDNLFAALQNCRRAYIFDNSKQMQLIAEKNPDNSLILSNEGSIPTWFDECVLSKINERLS